MEVDAGDPAEPAGDTLPFGSFKIQVLRPTVHSPPPRSTETRIERPKVTWPTLFQLFAEAFRSLSSLFSCFGI